MKLTQKHHNYPSAYHSFSNIPSDMKLATYESRFENEDLLNQYLSHRYYDNDYSYFYISKVELAEKRWKEICDEMDCHPSLAKPVVVKAWCEKLIKNHSKVTIKDSYLSIINNSYRYFMWHIDYPHTYNPIQFAVHKYSLVNNIWNHRNGGDIND